LLDIGNLSMIRMRRPAKAAALGERQTISGRVTWLFGARRDGACHGRAA